ncbi:MAG: DUF2232 domain-containing protein [Syntrophomonadaceae bacterium]|nr:DUF2232 domain-containing protein [Syntrophomonadaceae bacterium]
MPALIILAITSLACLLMASIPSVTFLAAIVWGSVLISAAFFLKRWQIITIYMINIGILYALNGKASLLFYLTFFGIAVLIMALMLVSNRSYYQIQKLGMITAILGVSIFMGVLYLGSGQIGVQEMEKQLDSYLQESMKVYEESGLMAIYEEQGLSKADAEEGFTAIAKSFARHLPAFYYLEAIMVIFLMLWGASLVSRKLKLERLKKRPYSQEKMPWQLVWITIAGLSLWLWGNEKQLELVYYIGSNILVVIAPISIYYGIAALAFKIKQQSKGKKKWITSGLVILSVIFPLSAVIFFGLLGLFDALLDFRKLGLE